MKQGHSQAILDLNRGMYFAPADFSHMLDFLGYVSKTRKYPKAK